MTKDVEKATEVAEDQKIEAATDAVVIEAKDEEEDKADDNDVEVDTKKDDVVKADDEKDEKKEKVVKEDVAAVDVAPGSVATLFEGVEGLPEGFADKVETIFEAAVKLKVSEAVERIEESAQNEIEERTKQIHEGLTESVAGFLDVAVATFMEENKVSVDSSLRHEILESLASGLHDLFVEHNIDVPQEKVDMLEAANTEKAELAEQVNTLTADLIAEKQVVFNLKKADVVRELSEGLAATQAEKFKSLLEDTDAKDIETFAEKAKTIRESVFKDVALAPTPDAPKAALSEGVKDNSLVAKLKRMNTSD